MPDNNAKTCFDLQKINLAGELEERLQRRKLQHAQPSMKEQQEGLNKPTARTDIQK